MTSKPPMLFSDIWAWLERVRCEVGPTPLGVLFWAAERANWETGVIKHVRVSDIATAVGKTVSPTETDIRKLRKAGVISTVNLGGWAEWTLHWGVVHPTAKQGHPRLTVVHSSHCLAVVPPLPDGGGTTAPQWGNHCQTGEEPLPNSGFKGVGSFGSLRVSSGSFGIGDSPEPETIEMTPSPPNGAVRTNPPTPEAKPKTLAPIGFHMPPQPQEDPVDAVWSAWKEIQGTRRKMSPTERNTITTALVTFDVEDLILAVKGLPALMATWPRKMTPKLSFVFKTTAANEGDSNRAVWDASRTDACIEFADPSRRIEREEAHAHAMAAVEMWSRHHQEDLKRFCLDFSAGVVGAPFEPLTIGPAAQDAYGWAPWLLPAGLMRFRDSKILIWPGPQLTDASIRVAATRWAAKQMWPTLGPEPKKMLQVLIQHAREEARSLYKMFAMLRAKEINNVQ